MVRAAALILAVALPLSLSASAVHGRDSDCSDARRGYRLELDITSERIEDFSHCVANSRGREDCDSEFDDLDTAHSNFSLAVGRLHADCPD